MSSSVNELPAVDPDSGRLNVVIDTPKGSRNKCKFDVKQIQWRLSKVLPQGMSFPYDFGFLPSTRGEDGDPLDILMLMDEPAFPGCVVPARLIGVLEAEQTESGKTVSNDRLVAVVETPYNPAEFRSLEEVGRQQLDEIEHFFVSYHHMEGGSSSRSPDGGPTARGTPGARDRGRHPGRRRCGALSKRQQEMNRPAAGPPRGNRRRSGGHAISFELKHDESLRKNIQRIARKQMDNALECLAGPREGSPVEAVHEARKSFKRIRAVLCLVRPVIDDQAYREENTCFRDVGRPLTEVRDAKILVETLDGIAEHFKEHMVD
jgi:inorganic pyrophosphatase